MRGGLSACTLSPILKSAATPHALQLPPNDAIILCNRCLALAIEASSSRDRRQLFGAKYLLAWSSKKVRWLFSEAPSCWLLIRHGRRPRFKHSLWWFQRQWQETSERVAQTTYSWIAAHSCKSGSQRTVSIWAKRTNIPCLQRITFELEHLGVSPQKCFLSLLDLPFPSASGHLLCLHQRMNLLCLRLWHSLVRSRQRPESNRKAWLWPHLLHLAYLLMFLWFTMPNHRCINFPSLFKIGTLRWSHAQKWATC